jgi:hypothetical protein
MRARVLSSISATAAAGLFIYACGGPTPPAAPSGAMSAAPSAPAPPAPPADSAPPTASAAPSADVPAKKPPRRSGPPMVVAEDDKENTSLFGISGGVIRIAQKAELVVPREALAESLMFTFGLNTGKNQLKVTPYKGFIGDLYRVGVRKEEAPTQPFPVSSSAGPFLVKLPVPKGTKVANLAIIALVEGKGAKYSVVASKAIEEGASGPVAVIELPSLVGDGLVHLTSAAPTP